MLQGFFSNPFASKVEISTEVTDFPEARRILFFLLIDWGKRLADPKDDCVPVIADIIEGLAQQFDIVKMTAYEDGARPGKCFGLKCDVIRATLHEVRMRLTEDPESRFHMAELVNMISKHVGRLSLNGYDAEDVFAYRQDTMVDLVQKRFQEDWPTLEEGSVAERNHFELYTNWDRLCVILPSCHCLQCGRRRLVDDNR
ncbi:hypothetical protein N7466_007129 [Penicillium verhagenii]|uniref:uncharacterized protein n=1 Tax=Penicillium verhagenii TaxID=1562060 RepID=UPI0025453EAA|nr:uncharacterized protein N7466_007129 [Penicillium verhagenii]KAJ5928173.1 hypothetical protein N7466_007129 [Penicillium verhagenii]